MMDTATQFTPPPGQAPPLFSIVIPVFNRATLVAHTIESVFAQTLGDYEIIVADDGSTDGTPEALAKYGSRVQVFTQPNKGEGGARNLGLLHARGQYLLFLDSDDLLLPWALETFAGVIRQHNQPALIYGSETFFSDHATLAATPRAALRADGHSCFLAAPSELFWRGVVGNVLRRDIAAAAGPFCEARLNALDIDYTLRCAAAPGFVKIDAPVTLAIYQHPLNVSHNLAMSTGGIEYLIQQEKSGRYPGGPALQSARRTLICLHARAQSVRAAQAGQAAAAWRLYRGMWAWNLAAGRWRYLIGLPIILLGGLLQKIFA